MNLRRSLFLLLVGLMLVLTVQACGTAAATEPSQPAAPEEPTGGNETAQALIYAPTAIPQMTQISPTQMPLPTGTALIPVTGGGNGPSPAIPETRRLTLEYAPRIRAGDSTRIRLQLEVDNLGNVTPTAIVEGNVVTGETVQIPNLYETHFVVAEARLDMAGVEVRPPDTISEPLHPGSSVTFYWSVRPPDAGVYEGTAWLHLHFIPISTLNGEKESRIPVSAQFVTIDARSLFGLSGGMARGAGAAGSVVGAVIGFPFFDDVLRWLWRRIRR